MPMPLWWGHINKRVFNKWELKRGERPVIEHIGRTSGKTYRTPLDAHRVDGGYIFVLVYGPESDWVKNILASGTATLTVDGERIELVSPRVVTEDVAWQQLQETVKRPPGLLKITDYLQMDVAAGSAR